MPRRRRWPYLVVALVLLGVGAYLTTGGEAPKRSEAPKVRMPRARDSEDRARDRVRQNAQTALLADAGVAPSQVVQPPAPYRDPVMAAMPTQVKSAAMVVEANALRNSDLGDAMVACLMAGAPERLGRMRDAGFDPLTQLDRVSLFDRTLMLTGDFAHTTPPGTEVGHHGDVALHRVREGSDDVLAKWRDQALLVGKRDEVSAALDRLEGRAAPDDAPPVLNSDMAFGEVYGVLKADAFAELFGQSDPRLASLIREATDSIELHVDAMHDVGVVAEVKGKDPQRVDELRRMLGGAVAAVRAQAAAKGDTQAAEVLDLSRILAPTSGGTSFNMELGLPYELLKIQLQKCVENGAARRKARQARSDAGSTD